MVDAELHCVRLADRASRVEKYRPDTLDDVSGHQDILVTINKFVDSNVGSYSSRSPSQLTHVFSDFPISCYMARPAQARRRQSWHWPEKYTATRTCGKWSLSSMLATIEG